MDFLPVKVSAFFVVLLLSTTFSFGQNEGLPFITNFSPKIYRQGPQNFTILQSKEGLLYIGNNNGVIVYDGHTWELIPASNQSEVHAMAEDANGKIYVGAQGEFGYLQPAKNSGNMEYVSMLHLVPEVDRNFNDIWSIYTLPDKVVFRSTAGIFIVQGENLIRTIKFSSSNHRSFFVYDEVFVREENFGLRKLTGDSLVLVPQGEKFLNEQIYTMLPINQNEYLVHSQNLGLMIYDGKEFKPFQSAVNDVIIGQGIVGTQLPDGTYALGTRRDGLFIINDKGDILQHISTDDGVINESIWGICVDKYMRNLWVATNNGLSFIETQSPFTSFQSLSGLPAQVYHLAQFNHSIYAATSLGVYYKDLAAGSSNKFRIIPDMPDQAWSFYQDAENLLVATNRGIFQIEDNVPVPIGFNGRAWLFVELKTRPGYVLVNTADGFVILKKEKKGFIIHKMLPRFNESLYYFVEDEKGNVWADSPIKGIFKITFDSVFSDNYKYSFYNSKSGLPSDLKVMAFNYRNEVRFSTEQGIYKYDPSSDLMLFDKKLNRQIFGAEKPVIEWMEEDKDGNIWFIVKRNEGKDYFSSGGYAQYDGLGSYKTDLNTFWRIHEIKLRDFLYLRRDQVFIGASEGIFHFNPEKVKTATYPVLVRSITLTKSDSVVSIPQKGKLGIPFSENNVKFQYAAMGFSGNSYEYQTFLEGFDENWQPWSTAYEKEFSQLPPGEYVFRLRAKDMYNRYSEELAVPFRVVTPWFKSPAAYASYGVITLLLIFLIVQWRSKKLLAQNLRLERIVNERTAALANAQLTIAGQNEELKNVNQNLEKKVDERTKELQQAYQNLLATKNELDTFIYRSSHDIKGPLLRLLGLCNVALIDVKDKTSISYFKMLEKEIYITNRILQKLIVYYYVKNAEVNIEKLNLSTVLHKVMESLQRVEGHNQISIVIDKTADLVIDSDVYLIETALFNVIENAITYRRNSDARVRISVSKDNGFYNISVSDNGKGISKDISKHIFEMFYRGSEYSPGAGLGLFITNLALKKINSSISFQQKDETVFTIAVPVLVAKEIVCEM